MNEQNNLENVEAVDTEETTGNSGDLDEKKYSDRDVDRIVSNRLKREREKTEKQQQRQQKEADFDERERNLRVRELKADARDKLSEDGYPKDLADFLSYDSEESFQESYEKAARMMDSLRESWEQEAEIKRSTGTTPKYYGSNRPDPIAEAFKPTRR